jgi:2-polyprenyl-3-methyl-5-hydroxy-6-metoxy-1,4-benzoquinol methylase
MEPCDHESSEVFTDGAVRVGKHPALVDDAKRIQRLIDDEREWTSSPAAAEVYTRFHVRRFDTTYHQCCQLAPDTNSVVCDVGRGPFTQRLAQRYAEVWSLGFALDADDGGHREQSELPGVRHIPFDLNRSIDVASWPAERNKFDLIVCAETIEHLHTPPEFTLMMLGGLLKPTGQLLITTPNAAGITRRLKLLLGIHPYERIRYFAENPGHFREYTRKELIDVGHKAGLVVRDCRTLNFYKQGLVDWLKLPPAFRDSLVAVYSRADGSA